MSMVGGVFCFISLQDDKGGGAMLSIGGLIVLVLTFLVAPSVHADPVTLTITEDTVLYGSAVVSGNLSDTPFILAPPRYPGATQYGSFVTEVAGTNWTFGLQVWKVVGGHFPATAHDPVDPFYKFNFVSQHVSPVVDLFPGQTSPGPIVSGFRPGYENADYYAFSAADRAFLDSTKIWWIPTLAVHPTYRILDAERHDGGHPGNLIRRTDVLGLILPDTVRAEAPFAFDARAWEISAPEPSATLFLLGTGLAGLSGFAWWRRRG
jgi:hypothetical protein